ncbi:hypothetical protein B0H17DRAFT_1093986 [Mycena rosella]|uniref:Uncharacterized protein n=1 Tax=Mycena rosella TaxID=1033263 RepID=A0AAD7G2R9_MYCRO|nr:hypothetical protein B0H17DRAFT_1093986 [Mycena rosella]
MAHSNRDSNSIRASVYDVFLELGAFDENSRVADWIFNDPSYVLPDPDEVASRSPHDNVRFIDDAQREQALQWNAATVASQARSKTSTPTSSSKSFFTPKLRTPSKSKSTSSSSRSPSGDGYETDEGYVSASPSTPKQKSRVRAVFSLSSAARSSPQPTETPTKVLPALPPIRERLTRAESSSSLAKAKSLFRKRPKSPSEGTEDDLQQWHEVSALRPRAFNPSAANGVPLAPPTSFRQIITPAKESGDSDSLSHERLSFALPRTIFRSISITKRATLRPRPPSLNLADDEPAPRLATSLPASPFILVTEGAGAGASPGPNTPFVFVSAIDNPTPLNSARWSQVTSMTAPMFPLSISRTMRRSMVLDNLEPAFPRLRPSSSYASLPDVSAARSVSPYELYNQPIPGIQRGREAPFPSRPILPQPLSRTVEAGPYTSRCFPVVSR